MCFHSLNPCTIPWKSFGISLMALSRFDSRPCCVYENKKHLRIFYVTDTWYNKRKWITCNSPYPILYNVNINENKDYWIFSMRSSNSFIELQLLILVQLLILNIPSCWGQKNWDIWFISQYLFTNEKIHLLLLPW